MLVFAIGVFILLLQASFNIIPFFPKVNSVLSLLSWEYVMCFDFKRWLVPAVFLWILNSATFLFWKDTSNVKIYFCQELKEWWGNKYKTLKLTVFSKAFNKYSGLSVTLDQYVSVAHEVLDSEKLFNCRITNFAHSLDHFATCK